MKSFLTVLCLSLSLSAMADEVVCKTLMNSGDVLVHDGISMNDKAFELLTDVMSAPTQAKYCQLLGEARELNHTGMVSIDEGEGLYSKSLKFCEGRSYEEAHSRLSAVEVPRSFAEAIKERILQLWDNCPAVN